MQIDEDCPFCGRESSDTHACQPNCCNYWQVICNSCGATLPTAETALKAIEYWNTRANEARLTATVKELREALGNILAISKCAKTFASIDTVEAVKIIAKEALLRAKQIEGK